MSLVARTRPSSPSSLPQRHRALRSSGALVWLGSRLVPASGLVGPDPGLQTPLIWRIAATCHGPAGGGQRLRPPLTVAGSSPSGAVRGRDAAAGLISGKKHAPEDPGSIESRAGDRACRLFCSASADAIPPAAASAGRSRRHAYRRRRPRLLR